MHENQEKQNEGILMAGTFNPSTHGLLYLTPGIKVSIDDKEIIEIPWAESKFIELAPDSHRFKVWYNWFGRAGESEGCFVLEPHQIIYFEYHPPMWGAFSKSEIILIDNKTSNSVSYDRNCGL